jgi:hypothetical protein
MTGPKPKPPPERFWPKVQGGGVDECWLWQGTKGSRGHGRFYVAPNQFTGAHRFAYEQLIGPVPDGLVLDHLCLTPPCVNPWHLDPVTSAVNTRRAADLITVCPRGHEYDEANTQVDGRGFRHCRACRRYLARVRRSPQTPTPDAPVAQHQPNPKGKQ